MGLLDAASGRRRLAGRLGGELLAGRLAAGGLAGSLLGTGHFEVGFGLWLQWDSVEQNKGRWRFHGSFSIISVTKNTTLRLNFFCKLIPVTKHEIHGNGPSSVETNCPSCRINGSHTRNRQQKRRPPKDPKKTEFQEKTVFWWSSVVDERDRKKTRKRQGKDISYKRRACMDGFGNRPGVALFEFPGEKTLQEIWRLPPAVAAVPAFGL